MAKAILAGECNFPSQPLLREALVGFLEERTRMRSHGARVSDSQAAVRGHVAGPRAAHFTLYVATYERGQRERNPLVVSGLIARPLSEVSTAEPTIWDRALLTIHPEEGDSALYTGEASCLDASVDLAYHCGTSVALATQTHRTIEHARRICHDLCQGAQK